MIGSFTGSSLLEWFHNVLKLFCTIDCSYALCKSGSCSLLFSVSYSAAQLSCSNLNILNIYVRIWLNWNNTEHSVICILNVQCIFYRNLQCNFSPTFLINILLLCVIVKYLSASVVDSYWWSAQHLKTSQLCRSKL